MTFRCWLTGHDWYELPVDNGLIQPWGLIAKRCRRCGVLHDHLRKTEEPNMPTTNAFIEEHKTGR